MTDVAARDSDGFECLHLLPFSSRPTYAPVCLSISPSWALCGASWRPPRHSWRGRSGCCRLLTQVTGARRQRPWGRGARGSLGMEAFRAGAPGAASDAVGALLAKSRCFCAVACVLLYEPAHGPNLQTAGTSTSGRGSSRAARRAARTGRALARRPRPRKRARAHGRRSRPTSSGARRLRSGQGLQPRQRRRRWGAHAMMRLRRPAKGASSGMGTLRMNNTYRRETLCAGPTFQVPLPRAPAWPGW
jgi:hypothetical protein